MYAAAVIREPVVIDAGAAAGRAEPDDGALVNAFRAGDRAAFEVLVRRHQRPVWAIVQRFARDRNRRGRDRQSVDRYRRRRPQSARAKTRSSPARAGSLVRAPTIIRLSSRWG